MGRRAMAMATIPSDCWLRPLFALRYGIGAVREFLREWRRPGRTPTLANATALRSQPGDQVDRRRDDERPKRVGEERVPKGGPTHVGGLQIGV
jgi:hypothetical protein